MSIWAKRHYETVARAIYMSKTGIPEIVRTVGEAMTRKPDKAVLDILMRSTDMDGTIDTLAHLFRIDNNSFDMERFKLACKTGKITREKECMGRVRW